MGATVEDVEVGLQRLADDLELGADHCNEDALGKLAEVVADVLSTGEVAVMRAAAARLSSFLRLVAGVRVPVGPGAVTLSSSEEPARGALVGQVAPVASAVESHRVDPTFSFSNATSDSTDRPIPERWREQVSGPLMLLIRQLRHGALAQEAREYSEANQLRSLTIDDRVLGELRSSGAQRSGDIARRLNIDPAQVSRSLTRLVRSSRARETPARSQDGRGRWYELMQPADEPSPLDVES